MRVDCRGGDRPRSPALSPGRAGGLSSRLTHRPTACSTIKSAARIRPTRRGARHSRRRTWPGPSPHIEDALVEPGEIAADFATSWGSSRSPSGATMSGSQNRSPTRVREVVNDQRLALQARGEVSASHVSKAMPCVASRSRCSTTVFCIPACVRFQLVAYTNTPERSPRPRLGIADRVGQLFRGELGDTP